MCKSSSKLPSSSTNDVNEVSEAKVPEIEVLRFEVQSVYPGVESNLRMTKGYHLKVKISSETGVDIGHLHHDGLALRPVYMLKEGEHFPSPMPQVKGVDIVVEVHFSRTFFTDPSIEPENVEGGLPTELDLDDDEYVLTLLNEDQEFQFPLKKPGVLEPVYAP